MNFVLQNVNSESPGVSRTLRTMASFRIGTGPSKLRQTATLLNFRKMFSLALGHDTDYTEVLLIFLSLSRQIQ